MNPVKKIRGDVDMRGLTTLESQHEAIRSEFRRVLPLGWRIKKSDYAKTPDGGKVAYTITIEPTAARTAQ